MNRKMIGEAIYIRVSDRKYNPIATKLGNVPIQSWRGKPAVIRIYHALTLNGYSNFIKAVKRQRNLGLQGPVVRLLQLMETNACDNNDELQGSY